MLESDPIDKNKGSVSMKYWFDKKATKNNIVILTAKALVVASADEASQEHIEEQLIANTHPKKIFGNNGFKVIPFAAIEDLSSSSVDGDLEISYKSTKQLAMVQISFDYAKSKLECMGYIKKLTLKNSVKSETVRDTTKEVERKVDKNEVEHLEKNEAKSPFTVKSSEDIESKPKKCFNFKEMFNPTNLIPKRSISKESISKESKKVFGVLKPIYLVGFASVAVAVTAAALYFLLPNGQSGPASLYQAIQTHQASGTSGNPIQSFLDNGADINYMAEDGTTPLITALNFNEETLAIELINKGAALSTQYIGQTPLDLAIEATLDKAVNSMLKQEMVTSNPQDMLMRSISSGLNFENIQLIADSGMDMNHADEEGLTALSLALLFGSDPKVVKLLLDRGASTKIKVGQVSPLEFATLRGYTEIAAMLELHSS